jgi:hypothetical protein
MNRHLKVDVLPSCKQMFLLINSQRVSAQIGHHQIIPEEYTNGNGICINYTHFYTKGLQARLPMTLCVLAYVILAAYLFVFFSTYWELFSY